MSIPRTKLIAAVTALGLGLSAATLAIGAPAHPTAKQRSDGRKADAHHAELAVLDTARRSLRQVARGGSPPGQEGPGVASGRPGAPAAIRRPSRSAPRVPRSTRSAPVSRVATQAPSQRTAATAASTSSTTAPGPRSAGRGTLPPPPRQSRTIAPRCSMSVAGRVPGRSAADRAGRSFSLGLGEGCR